MALLNGENKDPLTDMMKKMTILVQNGNGVGYKGRCYHPESNLTELISSPQLDIKDDQAPTKTKNLYHVSTRKIGQGNVICRIQPKMIVCHDKNSPGPEHSSLCLSCCKWFLTSDYACSECGWPVCSQTCEKEGFHAKYECTLFRRNHVQPNSLPDMYDAILAYRVIILMKDDRKFFKSYEIWKSSSQFGNPPFLIEKKKKLHDSIRKFLITDCRLFPKNTNSKHFTAMCTNSELGKLLRFIDTNSLYQKIPASVHDVGDTRNYHSAKFVFPYNYTFDQSCCPNVDWTINFGGSFPDSYLIMWTTQNIEKSERITISFKEMYVKHGTLDRRRQHRNDGILPCNCTRCKDPYELGSFASSILCQLCRIGFLVSINPLEDEMDWKCDNERCNNTMGPKEIEVTLEKVSQQIDKVKDNLSELLKLLKELETILHPQHYLCCRVADLIVDSGCSIVKNRPIHFFIPCFNFQPFTHAQLKCFKFASKVSPGYTVHRAKYIYFRQMIEGIRLTQKAVHCHQYFQYAEAQTILAQLEEVHRYQMYLIKILCWHSVGSFPRCMLEFLVKSESDLSELLRTSFPSDILTVENIERLRRAFSYFCQTVYYPSSSSTVPSLPSIKFKTYHNVFGY